MRKTCTGILAGVAGWCCFRRSLPPRRCATFAVEILSRGCEGQRRTGGPRRCAI